MRSSMARFRARTAQSRSPGAWSPPHEQSRRLLVEWTEKGGPDAAVRGPDGFGSTLIEKSLPDAKVTRVFGPDGLVCNIEVLLSRS